MSVRPSLHLLIAATLLFTVATAHAEGGGKVSNLSGSQPRGKLLTYDELAACLKEQAELAPRREKIEAERKQMDGQRKELEQLGEALKSEREKIEKYQAAVASINARTEEQSKKIADFNERSAKFENSGAGGPLADRERAELQRQRAEIEAAGKALDDDRKAVTQNRQQDVDTYNARVKTRDQAVEGWNARNAAITKAAQQYETDREAWASDCAGRPYREDDEKDILKGSK